MARDKEDAWSRYRKKEQEREKEEETKLKAVPSARSGGSIFSDTAAESGPASKLSPLNDLLHRAEVQLEQVQSLYNMYLAGQERTLPVVQRKQLDEVVNQVGTAAKPSAADRFRASQFISKVQAYRDRWDRMLKDLESGRVVRKKFQSRSSA